MKISVIMHTHRHGVDHWPYTGGEGLSLEAIALGLGIDYEAEREDEFLESFEINTDTITYLQDAAVLR